MPCGPPPGFEDWPGRFAPDQASAGPRTLRPPPGFEGAAAARLAAGAKSGASSAVLDPAAEKTAEEGDISKQAPAEHAAAKQNGNDKQEPKQRQIHIEEVSSEGSEGSRHPSGQQTAAEGSSAFVEGAVRAPLLPEQLAPEEEQEQGIVVNQQQQVQEPPATAPTRQQQSKTVRKQAVIQDVSSDSDSDSDSFALRPRSAASDTGSEEGGDAAGEHPAAAHPADGTKSGNSSKQVPQTTVGLPSSQLPLLDLIMGGSAPSQAPTAAAPDQAIHPAQAISSTPRAAAGGSGAGLLCR